MTRELKLVVSIFTSFFIYGLVSYFSLGDFVTPYFLSPLILVGFSGYLLYRNYNKKHAFLLFLNLSLFLIFAALDDFTIHYLFRSEVEENWISKLLSSRAFLTVTFIIAFTILFSFTLFLFKNKKKRFVLFFLSLPLILSIVFIVLKNTLFYDISLSIFYLLFIIFSNKLISSTESSVNLLSNQFLLVLLLKIFQFLV